MGAALETIKQAAKVVKDGKEKKREQRKRKQEFFNEQKMKKMAKMKELEKKKIPETILENLPCTEESGSENSSIVGRIAATVRTDKEKIRTNRVKKFSEEVDENDPDPDSFIPLDSAEGGTEFSVLSLKDTQQKKSASAAAAEFRNNMLFGSRVRREPVTNRIHRQKKLAASGKTSFVKA